MQSQQEQLVRELTAHSMGASFVFEPLEYSKGKARREHADLVWANNSTAILIGMAGGRTTAGAKRAHSLKQLRGGLRAWRDLQIPIRGVVRGRTVELCYSPSINVVLVTVENGNDAELVVHSIAEEQGAPVVIASVPQEVLMLLARLGGGSRDLLDLILSLEKSGPQSLQCAVEIVTEQHQAAWFASPLNLISGFYTDQSYRYYTNFLLTLRHVFPSFLGKSSCAAAANDFVGALDDVGWSGLFAFLGCLWSPDDPGPSILWTPRVLTALEHQQATRNSALFLKSLPGSPLVTIGTIINRPPPDVTRWPRIRTHSITRLHLGRHTFLVARVPGILAGPWLAEWREAWEEASLRAEPNFPPQGFVSWESEMGLGSVFVGSSGERGSDTHLQLRAAARNVGGGKTRTLRKEWLNG